MRNRMQLQTSVEEDGVQEDRLTRVSYLSADVLSAVPEPMTPETEFVKATAGAGSVFQDEWRKKLAEICELLHARALMRGSGCSQPMVWEDIAELFRSVQRLVKRSTGTCECASEQERKGMRKIMKNNMKKMRKNIVQAREIVDCDDVRDDIPREDDVPRESCGPLPPSKDPLPPSEDEISPDRALDIEFMTEFYLNNVYVTSEGSETLTAGQAVRRAEEMAKNATAVRGFQLAKEYFEWLQREHEKTVSFSIALDKITGRWDEALRNVQWLLRSVLWAVTRSYDIDSLADIICQVDDPSWLSMQGTKVGVLCNGHEFPITQELLKRMEHIQQLCDAEVGGRSGRASLNVVPTVRCLAKSVTEHLEPAVAELGQFLFELIFGCPAYWIANGSVSIQDERWKTASRQSTASEAESEADDEEYIH